MRLFYYGAKKMIEKMHDVVVIGAGPGGSALAYFLAKHGLDTVLLDKSDFPRDKTCGDGLSPRALAVLQEMDLLETVKAAGFVIHEATVYSPNGAPVTTQMPVRDDVPPYMMAIPRLLFDDMVRKRAIEAGATFQSHVRVQNIEQIDGGVRVIGKHEKRPYSINGRMAVIAIGANVKLLLDLGILKQQPEMIVAARAYYDNVAELQGSFEFHFDGIPLPGYGWVFPIGDRQANIGAGILRTNKAKRKMTSQNVLKDFLKIPLMQTMLKDAELTGAVKGYPLRTDFHKSPTYGERTILIGEAAGLVNPLTGEGIDYALESAQIAAHHLIDSFEAGDFSQQNLALYDQKLRDQFQRVFVFTTRIRDWYLNKPILNRLVYVANRRDELRELFTNIVLGNADAAKGLSPKTMMQIIFTR